MTGIVKERITEMAKAKRQIAFAVVDPDGHIYVWTIRGMAMLARAAVGKAWREEDWKEGWRAAKTEVGVRVKKIELHVHG